MQSHFFDFVLTLNCAKPCCSTPIHLAVYPRSNIYFSWRGVKTFPFHLPPPLPLNSLTPSSSSSSSYLLWMTQVKDVNGLTVKSSLQTPSCFISISATTTLVVRVPTTSVSHVSGKIAELPAQNGTTSLHISEVRRPFFFFLS